MSAELLMGLASSPLEAILVGLVLESRLKLHRRSKVADVQGAALLEVARQSDHLSEDDLRDKLEKAENSGSLGLIAD